MEGALTETSLMAEKKTSEENAKNSDFGTFSANRGAEGTRCQDANVLHWKKREIGWTTDVRVSFNDVLSVRITPVTISVTGMTPLRSFP